jgi:glucose/arabinose dehydrogenase
VFLVAVGFATSISHSSALTAEELEAKLNTIRMPAGFSIGLYAHDLPNARSFAVGERGAVFVGTRNEKHVYAVVDTDGDGRADEKHIVYTLGDAGDGKERVMPNGVAFREGDLYIATLDSILRIDDIESRLTNPPKPVVINGDYPTEKQHGWKFIAFGPDGKLYVPVGTPCNICDPEDDVFGTITRIHADGSGREIVAHGIRNTVGFDWHPETGELWFTENGADKMGDDIPADELNVITAPGQHFGNPYVHQGDIVDATLGEGHDPNDYISPAINLGPHVAALGMRFYTGDMFPAEYKNHIFIAEHGSGGREVPIGYRVTLVRVDGSKALAYEGFATGWIEDTATWGRLVDVAILPDGSMLVSDDRAGAIYRITYNQ